MVAGLLGGLKGGLYIVYALTALSIVYLSALVIAGRKQTKKLRIEDYITPGFVIFILSTALYAFVIRGKMLWETDVAFHWGYATRYMYLTDHFYKGIQTLGAPILNYFIVKTVGYQESYLYAGRWIMIWIPVCLAVSDIGWNKWYKAALYAIGAYMLTGVIDDTPSLLMDLPLGIFSGGMCAMLAWNNDDIRPYVTASFGIFVLTNIKNGFGLVMSVMVMGFAILVNIIKHKDTKFEFRKQGLGILLTIASVIISYLVNKLSIQPLTADTNNTDQTFHYIQIINNLKSVKFLGLLVITIILLTYTIVQLVQWRRTRKDEKPTKKLIILSAVSAMALIASLYKAYSLAFSALSHDDQVIFINFWELFYTKGYWGTQIRVLLALLIGFIIIVSFILIKKHYRTTVLCQSFYMLLCILGYALLLIIAYITVFNRQEAEDFAAHHRYIGSIMIFVMIWLLGLIFTKDDIWLVTENKQILCFTAVMILLSRDAPIPGSAYHFNIRGESGTHINAANDAKWILSNTPCDARIYFIAQNNDDYFLNYWSINVWLRYEIAPRYLNGDKYSLGSSYENTQDDYSLWNTTPEIWAQKLAEEYDYVYIYAADDEFRDNYSQLFEPDTNLESNTLYRVHPDGDYLLEPVESPS